MNQTKPTTQRIKTRPLSACHAMISGTLTPRRRDFTMTSFIICISHQTKSGGQTKNDEMGGVCGTYKEQEKPEGKMPLGRP